MAGLHYKRRSTVLQIDARAITNSTIEAIYLGRCQMECPSFDLLRPTADPRKVFGAVHCEGNGDLKSPRHFALNLFKSLINKNLWRKGWDSNPR